MTETYSRFGGLWIDRKDSEALLAERMKEQVYSDELGEKLAAFMRDGFIILKGAVSTEETALLRSEIDSFWQQPDPDALAETWIPGWELQKIIPPDIQYRMGTTKLLDFHAFSDRMRRAVANRQSVEFLRAIFEQAPKVFQGLTFWNGSQQPIHKDTAYVQVDGAPMNLAASWLALEDISEGTGELEYFAGSHRAPDFLFGGHSKWLTSAPDDHARFLQSHHDDAVKFGFEKQSFFAKEGDVLIWHADLAHGGAKITRPGKTRQSHVAHFTTAHDKPAYMNRVTRSPYETNGCLFIAGLKDIP